ncbi:nitrilase-related carbon-nitrogen hydrolase, partial [Longicatena sp. 210702-DFI.1.255]|uniref:nitrilase-related carbon-nitrogen hydrolase n=1 Tax=Longicatena sp. 210702-DFI.1.255 TaxID=2883229 RepID=UPI001D088DD2
YFVDPMDDSLVENAETLEGDFVTTLISIAGEYGVIVVAGLVERASEGARVRNTIVAVRGDGLLATYRKQ